MAIIKTNPTSAGRRHAVQIRGDGLHRGEPYSGLVEKKQRTGGRNNTGRITSRHIGGGHKQRYRTVDFKRTKDNIPARVERLEYDPARSAHLALLLYRDGERRYIIAPRGLKVGDTVSSGSQAPIRPGNAMALRSIPVGTTVHGIELKPGKGAQLVRSAGGSAQVVAREGQLATVRLASGEMRRIQSECRAVVGEVGHSEHSLRKFGKAGARRWQGKRPTVRGTAMNPVDHPHGGGEGRNFGRHPVTPWGRPTKGFKTRNNKRTDRMIVRRRKK
ncbi:MULTISPECIES: 50S ribosomal protein L2 [unclassified Thioalkalivibrio]|uniref:50S ribosomal protein L2 n=1 Tax=unclassified Thioalkalivibrio TaxID=2621013 RepID=UPI00036796BB|nr:MULTISPECIES: 50S ribosomal protein L2 [unclassified Thioalkalivibrio]